MKLKLTYHWLNLTNKIGLFSFSLFGYGVIASLVQDASTSRQVTIPYRAVVILLSILVLLPIISNTNNTNNINNTEKNKKIKWLFLFLTLLFIIFYSFRLFYDLGYNSFLIKDPNEYLLNWFGICLIPGITFLFLDLKSSRKYLYLSWTFLAITSALILPQLFQGQLNRVFESQGRFAAEAINPISLGHLGGSLLLLSLYALLNRESSKNKITKIVFIFSLLMGLTLLIFAASRGPIIAITVCVCLFLVRLQYQGINTFKIFGIFVFTVFFANIVISLALNSGSSLKERFLSLLNGDEFGSSKFVLRPELYRTASELIAVNPLFGYGLEVPNIGYPHNLILEAFLATGFLGGFLFLIINIYAVIKSIGIIIEKNNTWGWLGFLYIQYAISSMFSGSLYASYTFWYLLFAILGLRKVEQLQRN